MHIDDMEGITGGLENVINYRPLLSPAGSEYFRHGVEAWRGWVNSCVSVKLQGMSRKDIRQEIHNEAEAFYGNGLNYHLEVGPISILQACHHLQYADKALLYLKTHGYARDTELYRYLIKEDITTDNLSDDAIRPNHMHLAFKKCDESMSLGFSASSVFELMEIFRFSQMDMLSSTEQKLLTEWRYSRHALTVAGNNAEFKTGFTPSAIIDKDPETRLMNDGRCMDQDVEHILDRHTDYFLGMHRAWEQLEKQPPNAYSALVAQTTRQSFEVLQSLFHTYVVGKMTFSQFWDEADEGMHQTLLDLKEYKEYYKHNSRISRLPLIRPKDFEGTSDNFTDTFYRKELSRDGQGEFDRALQNFVNNRAADLGQKSADLQSFKANSPLYGRFDIPSFKLI